MGAIACDPASCSQANDLVQARTFYSMEDNGLLEENVWTSPVYLNTPSSADPRRGNESHHGVWLRELKRRIDIGEVQEVICLTPSAFHCDYFKDIIMDSNVQFAYAHLFRFAFIPSSGAAHHVPKSPTPYCILYFGPNTQRFVDAFQDIGIIPGTNAWANRLPSEQ